jgi:hypothetical protein
MIVFSKALGQISSSQFDGAVIGKITYSKLCDGFRSIKPELIIYENRKKSLVKIDIQRIIKETILDEISIFVIANKITTKSDGKEKAADNNETCREEIDLTDRELFAKVTKEEVHKFSLETGDKNPIHLSDYPIVQGMLLFNRLMDYLKFPDNLEVKFINPVFAGQDIYLMEVRDLLYGVVNGKRCFQVKFKKESN